jgi:hypothetical protein
MRKAIRIIVVLFLVIAATGCVATRKKKRTEPTPPASALDCNAIISNIKDFNITDGGLILKKGTITLEGTDIEGEFGITARLNNVGDILASVKGPLGIEVLRILSVGNDICGISKLSRTVYIGKKDALMQKHGLPDDFLKIIFGDMPDVFYGDADTIDANRMILKDVDESFEREINVCIEEMKVCGEDIYSVASKKQVSLRFDNFRVSDKTKYASEIEIRAKDNSFQVKLNIDELIPGYTGKIDFNVPSYQRESL